MTRTNTEISTSKSNRSTNRTPIIDTEDEGNGAMDREIVLGGDLTIEQMRDQMNSAVSLDVGTPDFKDWAENMAFMEELVVVRVHESTDPAAEKVVEVFCNGVPQRFVRGVAIVVKRKFVEVLARAKPFAVTTPQIKDGNGHDTTAINIQSGLRYPFEMQDKNPRGQGWLAGILREA